MGIDEMLSCDRVTLRVPAGDREEALGAVAKSLAARHPELGTSRIYESLWVRERLGSTGIGDGVAVPHARIPGLTETEVVVATCPDGVEFDAVDGKPVRILIGVLSPADAPREALRTLSDVVRCLKHPSVRRALECAESAEAVMAAMRGAENESPEA